jgi:ADP-ribose pyrophosphatase
VKPWELIEEPEVIKVGWRTIVKKVFRDPNGERLEAFTKDPLGVRCVATIGLTSDSKVIINEMFRPGPGIVMRELPGGGVEAGEDLEKAAQREFEEETGYTTSSLVYLGKVYKDAWGNAENNYFIAFDCKPTGRQKLDKEEFINVKEITLEELFDNAQKGLMTDTDGIFLAYDKLRSIQKEHEKTH